MPIFHVQVVQFLVVHGYCRTSSYSDLLEGRTIIVVTDHTRTYEIWQDILVSCTFHEDRWRTIPCLRCHLTLLSGTCTSASVLAQVAQWPIMQRYIHILSYSDLLWGNIIVIKLSLIFRFTHTVSVDNDSSWLVWMTFFRSDIRDNLNYCNEVIYWAFLFLI